MKKILDSWTNFVNEASAVPIDKEEIDEIVADITEQVKADVFAAVEKGHATNNKKEHFQINPKNPIGKGFLNSRYTSSYYNVPNQSKYMLSIYVTTNWYSSKKFVYGGQAVVEDRTLDVYLNGSRTWEDWYAMLKKIPEIFTEQLEETLVHEINHLSDLKKSPKLRYDREKLEKGDFKEQIVYLNQPWEVRSLAQEMLLVLRRAYKWGDVRSPGEILKRNKRWNQTAPLLFRKSRKRIMLTIYNELKKDGILR
jgi:hypothetical protein